MDPSNIDPTLDVDWKAEVLEEHAAKATSEEQLTARTWSRTARAHTAPTLARENLGQPPPPNRATRPPRSPSPPPTD